MKRNRVVVSLAVALLGIAGAAGAATTDTITVTVSLAEVISVAVAPNSWSLGAIALGNTVGPTTFTATVGNRTTKLEIVASDGAGGWTVGPTAGLNQFVVTVSNPLLALSKAYQVLQASVPAYGSQAFALTYSAPTTENKGASVAQGFSVMLRASVPTP